MSSQSSYQPLTTSGSLGVSDSERSAVPSEDSVCVVIQKAKVGEEDAVRDIWDRYFPRVVRLAGERLQGQRRQAADEEDVAISVMESFFRAARADRFPDLKDKDGIWRLLSRMTQRKVIDQVRRNAVRPAVGESAVRGGSGLARPMTSLASPDPTPPVMAMVADEIERLLEIIPETCRPIALMKLECLTLPEIAQHCGVHVSTAERRLKIIRGLWAKELQKADSALCPPNQT